MGLIRASELRALNVINVHGREGWEWVELESVTPKRFHVEVVDSEGRGWEFDLDEMIEVLDASR